MTFACNRARFAPAGVRTTSSRSPPRCASRRADCRSMVRRIRAGPLGRAEDAQIEIMSHSSSVSVRSSEWHVSSFAPTWAPTDSATWTSEGTSRDTSTGGAVGTECLQRAGLEDDASRNVPSNWAINARVCVTGARAAASRQFHADTEHTVAHSPSLQPRDLQSLSLMHLWMVRAGSNGEREKLALWSELPVRRVWTLVQEAQ